MTAPALDWTSTEKPILIAGPCAVESLDLCSRVADEMLGVADALGYRYVFKGSYDKANRTSGESFRSIGREAALEILGEVRERFSVPVLTDVHETVEVQPVAEVVDVLQIPAFLCRQTSLLQAAGSSGLPVNVKRGQFMAPEDMVHAAEKVRSTGNSKVTLTERGASFGYHNLVVDMRALPIMRSIAPVIYDVTHSLQQPGGLGSSTGGKREFAPHLARAAAAVGVDGFFIETHPDPGSALSDGATMIPLAEMEPLLRSLREIQEVVRDHVR